MCCRHNNNSRCRYSDNNCDEYDCSSDGSYFFYSILFYIFLFLFFYLLFRWIFFYPRASSDDLKQTIYVIGDSNEPKPKKKTKKKKQIDSDLKTKE